MAHTNHRPSRQQRSQTELEREVAQGQAYAAAMLTSIWGVLPPTTRNIPTNW